MTDLIERQAAIDAVDEGLTMVFVEHRDIAEKIINKIPSAQPECKPPIFVAEDRFIKNMFAEYPHCPKCNADIVTGQCYCSICGQHIDWSEEDE